MDEEDHLMSTSAYLENDEDGDDSYNFPSRPAVDTRMRHLAYNNGYDEKQSSNNNNYDNEDQFYSKKRKESILSDFNNSALHFDDNEGPDDYYDQHNVYDHDQYEDHDPLPINHSKNGYLPEPIPPPSSTADKSRFDKKTNNTRDTNTDKPPPKSFDDIPIKGGSSNPLDDVPIKANPSSMNSFKMDFVMEPKPKTTPPAEKPERSPKSGPFPFLKRGSRKEPSALHKKPQEEKPKVRQDERDFPRSGDYRDAEIVVKAPHSRPSNNNTSSTNLHATNGIGSSRHSQSTSKLGKEEPSRNRGNKAPAESYWGLDTTIMEDFHNLRENDQQDRRDQRDQRNRSQGGRQERDNFEESFPGGGEDTLDDIVRRTTQNRNNYRSTNTEVDDDDDVMIGDDYYEDGEEGMDELDHQSVASAEYDRYIQQVKQQSSSWGNVMQPKAVVPNHDNQYNDEEMPRDHGVKQPKVLLAKSTTQRLQQLRSTTPNPRANRTMSNDSAAFPASSNNHTTTSSSASTSVASQNHEGKLVRPVSSLKKDAKPSQSNNNRKSTPGQGKSTNRTNSKGTNGEANFLLVTDEHQKNLEQKMMELQQEIEIFKNKNIKIQKMEKQKEAELADILQKKEDIMKQCEEEKQKTKKWCDDQRQAAERERKLAAKQARDAREKANSNDPPIRKEKAEIEGLKATIEKLKINNDTAQQKWKLDTNRLHELVKDYSNHIENLEKQLVIIEEQKIQLIEFIQENGLKLPKNLRQKLSQTPEVNTITNKDPSIKQMKETLAMKQKTLFQSKTVSKTAGNKGFVEEVDIEVYTPGNNLPASSSYQYKIISEDHQTPGNKGKQSSQARARASSQGEEQFDEDYVRGNGNKTDYNLPPGEVFTRLSSNLKNGFASGSVPSTVTKNKTKPTTSLKSSNNLNASWAVRSSRSSARYSSSLEEEDEGYIDEQNDSANFDEDERERGGGGGRFDSRDDLIGQLLNHHHQQQQKQTTSANPSLSSNVKAQQKNGSSYMNENLPLSSLDPSQSTQGNKATFEKMKSLSSIELDEGYKRSPIPPSRSSHQMQQQQQQQQQHHNKNTADQGNQGGNVPGTSRTEEVRPDGTRVIHYRNGTIKEINPSGHVLVRFVNGDTKFSDGESGKVIYFYAQANTTHTTFPNGLELYQFPNGQTEKHYPDGKKEVTFPDKTKKIIYVDGTQESIFPDGVILKEFADGTKEVLSSANR